MTPTWAFIYVAPDTDPETDRVVIDRGGIRNVLVPVPEPSASPDIAVQLVDEGATLIELCGVHGLPWAAKVIEAVGDRAPVGVVTFGPEAIAGLTAFRAQFEESELPAT
jgi:Family of unknown function (DUF6506)